MAYQFLASVISSLVASVFLTSVVIWLAKSVISNRLKEAIKNEYDQKLESHKAQLKAQTDIETEKLRSELRIASVEHEVTFSRLHEQRAQVISETYASLKHLFDCVEDYMKLFEPAGGTTREQRRAIATDAHLAFREKYSLKLIFFPKSTADKLDEINVQLVQAFNQFVFGVDMMQRSNTDTSEKQIKILEHVGTTIRSALLELETEFRRLLGDRA